MCVLCICWFGCPHVAKNFVVVGLRQTGSYLNYVVRVTEF